MNTADDLKRFLGAMSDLEQTPVHAKRRAYPFITISRQAGAGGHTLAETLLRLMAQDPDTALFGGWRILDQQLCELLARDPHVKVSMEALLSEQYLSQTQAFVHGLFSDLTDQNIVMVKLFELVRSFAGVGKVIIVGRAGSLVTRGLPLGVHVRLVAPEAQRVRRMSQLLNQPEAQAKQSTHQQDNDRARLLRTYFSADINDPLLYDVAWNTGTTPFDLIARTLIALIKQRVAAVAESS